MKLRFKKLICIVSTLVAGILVASAFMNGGSVFALLSAENQFQQQKITPNRPVALADIDKTPVDVPDAAYKDTLARLRVYRNVGNLADLIKEGEEIERQWGENGGNNYGLLLFELVSLLQSPRINGENPAASELSQKYVLTALNKADSYDLETERFLLMYLRYPIAPSNLDILWMEQRRIRVKFWLHALHRLESEKDENFDLENGGPMKVEPPSGANGFPGMAPESIKDPKLRAEYERAIDKNTKRIIYRNQQFMLRKHEPFLIRDGVKYISKMYGQFPFNLQELDNLMSEFKISRSVRENIKNETMKAITEQEP